MMTLLFYKYDGDIFCGVANSAVQLLTISPYTSVLFGSRFWPDTSKQSYRQNECREENRCLNWRSLMMSFIDF